MGDDTVARALARDHGKADLGEADRAMLDYAVALTRRPSGVDRSHVETLRRAGFGDAAILDICQVTAYYNYVNRLADGLGVELEESWDEEDLVITEEELEALRRPGGS